MLWAWVIHVAHPVLVVDRQSWKEVGRIAVHGQPVFVVAQPDGRQVWVNFAHPLNDTVQVIDTPENRGMINKIHYMLNVEDA